MQISVLIVIYIIRVFNKLERSDQMLSDDIEFAKHNPHTLILYRLISSKVFVKHRWSNGRISPCQGGGPGPIPGRCNSFFF